MFTFQAIFAEFVTYAGSKKIKFKNNILTTNDEAVAAHLRSNCKGIVTEIKPVVPKAEPKDEAPAEAASKKSGK